MAGSTVIPGCCPSAGEVLGPGFSTDNAVARWDGTDGDTLQNSVVIIDDSGNTSNMLLDNTNTITVKDANLTIQDDADTTKQVKFQASGVTTGTTRTLAVPNASTTIVGDDATQVLTNKTMSGASNTFSNISLTASVTGTLPVANGGTNTSSALNNNRVMISNTGAIREATAITAARALISDADGIPVASSVTDTTLAFLDATSSVQTQLNNKQPLDSDLTAVAGLSTTGLITRTGSGTAATRTVTGTTNEVSVSNGDGVAGNPTLSLPSTLVLTSKTVTADTQSAMDNSTKVATTAYVATATREKLTASRTYFVRTDGNDSNTGLVNSAGGAFLTINRAVAVVAGLDINTQAVTIQLGNTGTYAGASINGPFFISPGGSVTIRGDTAAPGSYVISSELSAANDVRVSVQGLDFTSSGSGIISSKGAVVSVNGACIFGACSGHHLRAIQAGVIEVLSNYTIDGGAASHFNADHAGILLVNSLTITLSGTPAFSIAFVLFDNMSYMHGNANTFSGSATGTRYSITGNATVYTNNASATYFPGNAAGVVSGGGRYASSALPIVPQIYVQTTGSGTFTTPTNAQWLEVTLVGGGGGGAGSGTGPGAATAGGNSTFGSSFLTSNGGALGRTDNLGAAGGTASGGDLNIPGSDGKSGGVSPHDGGDGGSGFFGGGAPGAVPGNAGVAATVVGTGGSGGGGGAAANSGGGGGAGAYCFKLITSPSASYAWAIAAAGAAGTAGTAGTNGGAGASGLLVVKTYF